MYINFKLQIMYTYGDLFKLLMSVCVDRERRGQRLEMTRHKSPLSISPDWPGFLKKYKCSRINKIFE